MDEMSWACSTCVVNKKCVQNCELEVEGKWGKLLVEDINDLLMSAGRTRQCRSLFCFVIVTVLLL